VRGPGKMNAIVQSNLGFLPFVKVIKHGGKLSFFIISENIHIQNTNKNVNNSGGISVEISCSIAYSVVVYCSTRVIKRLEREEGN
jgi:hypothetical protein